MANLMQKTKSQLIEMIEELRKDGASKGKQITNLQNQLGEEVGRLKATIDEKEAISIQNAKEVQRLNGEISLINKAKDALTVENKGLKIQLKDYDDVIKTKDNLLYNNGLLKRDLNRYKASTAIISVLFIIALIVACI